MPTQGTTSHQHSHEGLNFQRMTKRHRTIGNVIWLPILENSFGTFCIEWNTSTHFNHHFCHLNPREMKCMSIQRLVNMNTHSSFICYSPNLQSSQMSLNRWMINKPQCIHTLANYWAIKSNKILIPATTWISCQRIMLSKKKKIIPKCYTLYDSIYITVLKL